MKPVPVEEGDLSTWIMQVDLRTNNEKVACSTLGDRHSSDDCARAKRRKGKKHKMIGSMSCGT